MSSKAYFAPFALLLKLCDDSGQHDWDDDYVEESPLDAGVAEQDCGLQDAEVPDANVDGGVVVTACVGPEDLYAEGSCDVLAEGVRPYAPLYPLWSDGAEKDRFVRLPPNTRIDAQNADFWTYPVGTKLYKTFSQNGVRLETRIIERVSEAPAPEGWTFKSYAWSADQQSVTLAPKEGVPDVLGTQHDIPSEEQCLRCHTRGGQDGINGFSAIQLNHEFTETSLADLIDEGLIATPSGEDLLARAVAPGTPLDQAALGYLHSNCGVCHGGESPRARLGLRLKVGDDEVRETDAYRQSVNVPLFAWVGDRQVDDPLLDRPYFYRIIAGHPERSGLLARMSTRGNTNQMPPLATERIDEEGHAIIAAWISSLRPRPFPGRPFPGRR